MSKKAYLRIKHLMNYLKVYDQIIEKAKNEERVKTKTGIYYENHHIIPKCLNGSNEKSNLVLLTGREHFICHWLLARAYPKDFAIINSFNRMCYFSNNQSRYTPSSRSVEEAKELFGKTIGNIHRGVKRSPETCKKISDAKKLFNPGLIKLLELNKKGKVTSEETKEKIRQKLKNIKPNFKIVICPHCNKEGKENVMYRWHFKNCKKI